MRFFSVFILSIFLIIGFALAVQKEENSDALRKSDRALSARDDDFTSATLPASLNTDDPSLKGLDPGSRSPLLAQITDEAPGWGFGLGESAVDTAGGMLDLLGNRIGDVGNVLGDDYPTNAKVTFPFMGLKKDGAARRAKKSGQTSTAPGEKQGETGAATGDEGPCPPAEWLALKTIPWCDYGQPWSVIKDGRLVNVNGYACMFFS